MEKKVPKPIFVKLKVNRIELDPITSIDPNPLPAYTYGSVSRETFPQTFPFVRRKIESFLKKANGDIRVSAKAIIKNNGKFLLVKDSNYNTWEFPGGHIQEGEATEEALLREVDEETGLTIGNIEELGAKEIEFKNGNKINVLFFSAESTNQTVKLSHEHDDFKWISLEEIKDYDLGPFLEILEDNIEAIPKAFIIKEGVGTVADTSNVTFGGSEGKGKEVDFFTMKNKINDIVNKSTDTIQKYKIYLSQGENAPDGKDVHTGSKGGRFYESSPQESTLEEASPKDKLKMNIIANKFKQSGFRLFEVGGSIRDELLGKPSSDRDFATDALPEETEKILNSLGSGSVFTVGKEYGTIGLDSGEDKKIEITTFRDEVYPKDSRKPNVTFGTSLEKDLSRRDFVINAMAKNTLTGEIVDLFGGKEDLKNKIIRTVGNSKDRYAEDPLRMLRAVRFAVQLGFKVQDEMPEPEKLNNISKERINSEFSKILTSKDPMTGIRLLDKFGLMEYIIPAINKMKDIGQNAYHKHDVYEHTMETVKEASETKWEGNDKLVIMLAALLHDIGKPETRTEAEDNVHFYDHQKVGSKQAESILQDLKFDNKTIERVVNIVNLHMNPMMVLKEPEDVTNKWVAKLVRKVGNDKDALILVDLAGADANASARPRPEIFDKLKEKTLESINTQKPNEMVSPLDGKEIMENYDLKAGRIIGNIKDYLAEKIVDGELNEGDKEAAHKLVVSYLEKNPDLKKSFIKKAWINFDPKAEKPPKGAKIKVGPRRGYYYEMAGIKPRGEEDIEDKTYYEGTLPGRKQERAPTKDTYWEKPGDRTHSWGNVKLPAKEIFVPGTLMISSDPTSHLQITWVDPKNRARQYLITAAVPYPEEKEQKRKEKRERSASEIIEINENDKKKWTREKKLNKDMPKIKKFLNKNRDASEEALILYLQFLTALRVGAESEVKTSGDVQSYGIRTLKRRHVKLKGNSVSIEFSGKDGTMNSRVFNDRIFANKVRKVKNAGDNIFEVSYRHINNYIKQNLGDYQTHDFRRWNATRVAKDEILKMKEPTNLKEFKTLRNEVGTKVGKYLYNSQGDALGSYIWPEVFAPWAAKIMAAEKVSKGMIEKSEEFGFKPFSTMDELSSSVHYPTEIKEHGKIRKEIDNLINKARIYLGPQDMLPPGKKLMFGPRGGRYYDSELEVYKHLWERVKERQLKEEKITNVINYLENRNLPSSPWWIKVEKDGIIVGQADKVQTVLKPNMNPKGLELTMDE